MPKKEPYKQGELKKKVEVADEVVKETVEQPVEESKEPKLFGVATCDTDIYRTKKLNQDERVGILGQGQDVEITGEAEDVWKTKKGYVSKLFILKKYV